METWRSIPGWEGLYEVSDLGRVRSVLRRQGCRAKVLTPSVSVHGYYVVNLSRACRPEHRRVHKLVAEAFLGPCPEGQVVDHVNGDKLDNRLGNIRYIDAFANSSRAGKTVSGLKDGVEVARVESAAILARIIGLSAWVVCKRLRDKGLTINGITWNYCSTARGSATHTR